MLEPATVSIVEKVWGAAFEELAHDLSLHVIEDGWLDPQRLTESLDGSSALVVRNRTTVDRALLTACPSLRVIARAGVGLDNIDLTAADELGVVVVAPVGVNAISVAEHTLGLALAVARQTLPLDRGVRSGQWDRRAGREFHGRVWGLLGFGATARAVVPLARGLGMQVVAYDPYVTATEVDGVRMAPLDEVVQAADVLSVHVPATEQTKNLVDAVLLGSMKPDAILVNVGRGEVVDEDALADALAGNRLLGAGLDVRSTEPPGEQHRLHQLDNVVLTPHVAGITAESQEKIVTTLADNLRALFGDGEAPNPVGEHRNLRDRTA
ncbi:MAG: phosphoglycerate dehydrogenase [Streptosporangiales bacterium]|nr:phosphoglycerate dehydrogenase [Streptosporangiales bacterium]